MKGWVVVILLAAMTVGSCRSSLSGSVSVASESEKVSTDSLSALVSVISRRMALGEIEMVIDSPCLVVVAESIAAGTCVSPVVALTARKVSFASSSSETSGSDSVSSVTAVSSATENVAATSDLDVSGETEAAAGSPVKLLLFLFPVAVVVFLFFVIRLK